MTGKEKLYWAMNDARALVANGWCKIDAAQTEDGKKCDILNVEAKKFCVAGANYNASKGDSLLMAEMITRLYDHIPDNTTKMAMISYNDMETTTHADILKLYDNALSQLKKEIDQ